MRVMIGGTADKAVERTVRWAEGWTAGGAGPEQAAEFARRVREAWKQSGRKGDPRIVALTYFALGPSAEQGVRSYLGDDYAFLGEWVDMIIQSAPTTYEAVKESASKSEEAGIDELIFDPTIADLDQIDRLAEAVL